MIEQKEQVRRHSHYYKSVIGLNYVDVYRVLKLFEVTDPCIAHAIKKLLLPGGRGGKSQQQDVQEAIDTLNRYVEMIKEQEISPQTGKTTDPYVQDLKTWR